MRAGLVSVVVASYNHAEFLQRRMDSLLAQTYPHIEIIVIEDCSPDNSLEILRSYESDPRVTLVAREQNGGWVDVFNQGIEMAGGEFILHANCDDACHPEMIEILVAALRRHPTAAIAFCRSLLIDSNDQVLGDDFSGRERAFRTRCENDTLIAGCEMSRFLLHSCVIPNTGAALVRKGCFDSVGNFSCAYKVSGDWDFFFRVAEKFDFSYVATSMNYFRQHGTTIRSLSQGRTTYEEYFRLLLGKIHALDLSYVERCKYRTRVMALWGHHILTQPLVGLRNFPFHLSQLVALDPPAILFLPIAILQHSIRSTDRSFTRLFGKSPSD